MRHCVVRISGSQREDKGGHKKVLLITNLSPLFPFEDFLLMIPSNDFICVVGILLVRFGKLLDVIR